MSEVVGEAVLVITTDDKAVKPGVDSASKNVTRGLGDAGKRGGESFSKGFSSSLKGLAGAAGLAFGADKAVDFLKSGLEAATSFQDEVGALGVIIGKSGTDKIIEFGESSAQAFGISKVAALEAAHTFATFGKSAGLSGDDLADFSTKFTGLAGDLASFNGGSTEDAITAIGSALRGEAEPIRRYGVLLDDATLKQAALRLGIIKSTKEALTPQQKVLAAQAEIFRQTKDAQGDSARTADSAANSQKRLTAQLADLRLEIGTQLLPVATKVTQAISEFVTQMQDGTGAGGQFVDVLQQTAAVGKTVFDLIDGLPGPVKKYGIELLIAGVALSKLTSFTGGAITRLQDLGSSMQNAEIRSARLGGAMRSLAGAGGAVLLSQGLQQADNDTRALQTTLGAAAVGFSLGGPIGAAVGALAGFTTAVVTANDAAAGSFDSTAGAADAYAVSIDNVTGKLKKNATAEVVSALTRDNKEALLSSQALGISNELLVRSLQGSPDAIRKVNEAIREGTFANTQYTTANKGSAGASQALTQALQGTIRETGDGVEKVRGLTQAFAETRAEEEKAAFHGRQLTFALKGIPTDVATKISAPGSAPTLRDIETLVDKYDRTPDQVKTLVQALNVKPTQKELQVLIDRSVKLGDIKPKVVVDADTSRADAKIGNLQRALRSLFAGIDFPGDGKGKLQSGTSNWRGGFSTVGETGPELAWFPKGTKVSTAAQSRQIAARGAQDGGVGFGADPAVVALLEGILLATAAVGPARTAAGIGGAFNAAGLAAYRSTGQRMGVR